MTNLGNEYNYKFRTKKFRDRYHPKVGVSQGCILKLILTIEFNKSIFKVCIC